MNNVTELNGCFPLLVRISGLFAILPVIIPSFLPFLSLPSFLWCFLVRVPEQPEQPEQGEQGEQGERTNYKWCKKWGFICV